MSRAQTFLDNLSAVPVDPDEARAFLQRRLAAVARFFGGIWTLTLPIDFTVSSATRPEPITTIIAEFARQPGPWLHAATAVSLLVTARVLRRGPPRAVEMLGSIDAVMTLAQASALAVFVALSKAEFRPELPSMLGVAHLLALRAAMIPSAPRRTALTGVGAVLALTAGTAFLNATQPQPIPANVNPLPLVLLVLVVWGAISIATSSLISAVIYGLEKRVRAAAKVGQYTLVEKLGEGGMGKVYRARHSLLRRPTAIKMLHTERAAETDLRRFEREVQLTSKLSHPNVVAIYDFGRSPGGVFYYAMEFLDGVDLELLVDEDGPQPPSRVLHILKQAADALAEAHAVGLIHRDIKPANMILCERTRKSDQLKIVDFGLVKAMTGTSSQAGLSDVTVLKGTPLYMAPEAIMNPEEVDARTDLYALGAVGYFLLTGKPVFEGTNIVEICGQHVHSAVIPIAKRIGKLVSPQLEAAIVRCLAKKPHDRWPDAQALLDALEDIDDLTPWTDVQASGWWKETAPSLRDRRSRSLPADPTFAIHRAPRPTNDKGDDKANESKSSKRALASNEAKDADVPHI